MDEVTRIIDKNQITLLLIPGKNYNQVLSDLVAEINGKYDKFLYIALNRPVVKLLKELETKNVKLDNFAFIDSASTDMTRTIPLKNCTYVQMKDLTALSIEIGMALHKEGSGLLLFDSLHTMLSFQDKSTIARFAHDLISRLGASEWKGVFPATISEQTNPLTSDLEMFVDEVVEIS